MSSSPRNSRSQVDNISPNRLSPDEWHAVMVASHDKKKLSSRILNGELSSWGAYIAEKCEHANSVVEIGSGTSEISLYLALQGKSVTLVDYSQDCLDFSKQCAEELGVKIQTVKADATEPFSFSDQQFDCVWSSGLLEHFDTEQRIQMLSEQGRISRNLVISLVPNAASLAYHLGKREKEKNGTWQYGYEHPLHTQQGDFMNAGLDVIEETTISPDHALCFLSKESPMRSVLSNWIQQETDPLELFWQGYLLATVGQRVQ